MISSIPAATASSTIYCSVGLSTSGNISLGMTLVAGKTRVPRPATGNTALRIDICLSCSPQYWATFQSVWRYLYYMLLSCILPVHKTTIAALHAAIVVLCTGNIQLILHHAAHATTHTAHTTTHAAHTGGSAFLFRRICYECVGRENHSS